MKWDPKGVLIGIPSALLGGTEIQTCALAGALVQAGYRVTICCFHQSQADILEMMRQTGAEAITLNAPTEGNAVRKWATLARPLAAAIRSRRPRFVHLQCGSQSLVPILTARLMGVPRVLLTMHFAYRRFRSSWGAKYLGVRLCDAFVCVSRSAEESFFGDSEIFSPQLVAAGRRHFTIPNGVDLAMAQAVAQEPLGPLMEKLGVGDGQIVGVVGRLRPIKGHAFLLAAMAKVVAAIPAAKLLVVGEGKRLNSLVRQAAQLGLEKSVIWAGALVPREAMLSFRAMDVVAVPSKSEGFGLVAAEAMALGRAVVASDVTGLKDVVSPGKTGLLVPYGDETALARAIIQLLQDTQLRNRLGGEGPRRVAQNFSLDTFARRYIELYNSL